MKKILILFAGMLVFFTLLLPSGNAVTNNTTAAQVSANVRETISVTLSGVPIAFGSLNAGSNNNPANDLNISIDFGTNVKTNISLNGTNFDCVSGGCTPGTDTFAVSYLRHSNASGAGGLANSTTMSTSFPLPLFTDWANIAKPTGSQNQYRNISFWLSIPAAQTGGNYQTNIYVNVSKYGG